MLIRQHVILQHKAVRRSCFQKGFQRADMAEIATNLTTIQVTAHVLQSSGRVVFRYAHRVQLAAVIAGDAGELDAMRCAVPLSSGEPGRGVIKINQENGE